MGRDADGLLAQRHLGGDPQAFGALVDRYQAPILTFIHSTVSDRERAEHLAQEVFVRAFRHLHRLDATTTFSDWIYAIASRLVWQELRSRARPARRVPRYVEAVTRRLSGAFHVVAQAINRGASLGRSTQ